MAATEKKKSAEKRSGDWTWVYTKKVLNAAGDLFTIYYQKTRWREGKREYLPAKNGGTKKEQYPVVEEVK